MNIWECIDKHPHLTFWIAIAVCLSVCSISGDVWRCWNRLMRCFSIRKQGWPPPHCDADGDPPEVSNEKTK